MEVHVMQHRDHLAQQVLVTQRQLTGNNIPVGQSDCHAGEAERFRAIGELLDKLVRQIDR